MKSSTIINSTAISRRDCLKGGLVAGGVASLLGAAGQRQAAAAVNPVNCVRSPWAHYHFSTNLSPTGNPALDFGNECLPALRPLTADPLQWKPVFWFGNGIDRGLEMPWRLDPVGFDALMMPGQGAWLLGVEIYHPKTLLTSEIVYSAGKRFFDIGGISSANLLELKINVNGKFTLAMWDDAGQKLQTVVPAQAGGPGSSRLIMFIYVDHRPGGPEQATIYQYTAGTTTRLTSSVSIAGLGPITGGASDSRKHVTVGVGRNASNLHYKHFDGWIRGMHIFNFGQRPPANLDAILDELSLRRMVPGNLMGGI